MDGLVTWRENLMLKSGRERVETLTEVWVNLSRRVRTPRNRMNIINEGAMNSHSDPGGQPQPEKGFRAYAWAVLLGNQLVILWGALVRATGSGAGCGGNWPLCDGQFLPPSSQLETVVEYTHRVTSGMAFLAVAGLVIWAYRRFPKGHELRKTSLWSLVFMVSESLLGASLVLFGWVVDNTSAARVIVQVVHLLNTHFLLGAIALTAWRASGYRLASWKKAKAGDQNRLTFYLIAFLAVLVLSAAGAVTALGDTIFPPETLSAGLQEYFSPSPHLLIRLRVWHPLIAVLVGAYLLILMRLVTSRGPRNQPQRVLRGLLIGAFGLEMLAGAVNIYLLAPVWMQVIHLFLADLIWVYLLLWVNETLVLESGAVS